MLNKNSFLCVFPPKKVAPRLSWMQKYEWREKMRLRTAEMSPSFFFLFDIKLRVGSEEMENKRLAAVVTGERPKLNEVPGGRRDLI